MDPDGDLRPRFIPIIDDPIGVPAMDIDHCPYATPDYKPALDAIVTEFIVITPRSGPAGEGQEQLKEKVERLAKELDLISPRKMCVRGESIEKPGTWVVSVGWNHANASALGLFRMFWTIH